MSAVDFKDCSKCQKHSLKNLMVPGGKLVLPPVSLRLQLVLTRRLKPKHKKLILKHINHLFELWKYISWRRRQIPPIDRSSMDFEPGSLVQVRSLEEIRSTLNFRSQLKGCTFMEEMSPYCGTTQKVYKQVKWFVDERDHQLKRTNGIVLLEEALCQGLKRFGPCDRSCYYFWRTEWLEKA